MKSKTVLLIAVLLLGVSLIAACDSLPALPGQATEEAESTEIPIVIADTEIISEGRLAGDCPRLTAIVLRLSLQVSASNSEATGGSLNTS